MIVNNINKISACLVIINEENVIKDCLESIKGVVDEIIVIHDGPCADKTLDICKEYTNKIFVQKYIGNAEPHRSFSYQRAQGEWILQIDADERLSLDLQKNIRRLSDNQMIDAYEFLWPKPGSKRVEQSNNYKRCFFRRNKISFLGIPHYIVEVKGKVKRVKLILEHRPAYEKMSWKIFRNKWIGWAKIQADYYNKDFISLNKFNYKEKDWSIKMKIRLNFSIIFMLFDFIITGFKELLKINFIGSLYEYKLILMKCLYRIILDWQIFKGKLKKIYEK